MCFTLFNEAAMALDAAWNDAAVDGVEYPMESSNIIPTHAVNDDPTNDDDNDQTEAEANTNDVTDDIANDDIDDLKQDDELLWPALLGVVNRRRTLTWILLESMRTTYADFIRSPQRLHISKAGKIFMDSFNEGPDTMWLETFRMTKRAFYALEKWLDYNTDLEGGYFISLHEKLFIFLYMIIQGVTQTAAAYFFGHSDETINR